MPFARNYVCPEVWISYKPCQIGLDRRLALQPSAPASKEWVEIRGYDDATGACEMAKMRNVSWIFPPVTVQKHNIVATLQPRKDILSPSSYDGDAPGEISLLERFLCKSSMLRIFFNRVHMTIGSCRRSHHGGCVSVAAADL